MENRESVKYAVAYDDLFNQDKDDEYEAWLKTVLEPANIEFLERFIRDQLGGDRGPVHYMGMERGSYNLVLQFHIDDGRAPARLALRMPQRGFSVEALAAERLENEVYWMQYIEEQSTVPVPHIYSWAASGDAVDDRIGPYMIMDYVEGQTLHAFLAALEASDDQVDAVKKRTTIFEQLADILLQLRSHRFDKIGSITRTDGGSWAVSRRPLTYDMHAQLASMPGFSTDGWPTGPLLHAKDYVSLATALRNHQMLCLRNINIPGAWNKEGYFDFHEGDAIDIDRALKTARGRFLARHAMALPAAAAHIDDNDGVSENDDKPFVLFNPDLSASNVLVDPDTARITALIDFEYTNAVPAAFADDPPVWLVSSNFVRFLTFGFFAEWQVLYKPTLDAFLAVLERVEQQQQHQQPPKAFESPPLSVRMLASWNSKAYLANYALQRVHLADTIYHDQPALFPTVPEAVDGTDEWLQKVHAYEEYTRWQIDLYEADRKARRQNR
ncbi:phosphotransferase enzyme family protein [Ophiostoma piceae UAMH 11346]|uniref:Phosphotransferase enzyme family protein n=1 Tax=Ophiostoma piceae (strain UAMH 11346) TaxID=1262450 RepID=S3C0V0_OPHP1|nr:phosphotransferase enzyme family protein [Ophiostoma piceae UAMH 11346]